MNGTGRLSRWVSTIVAVTLCVTAVPVMPVLPVSAAPVSERREAATGAPVASGARSLTSPDSGYVDVRATRLLDTRARGARQLRGGATVDVTVAGIAGVPTSGVAAVLLNVAAVDPSKDTYLTVWPTGTPRPSIASLNASGRSQMAVSNAVIVPLGTDGKVSLSNAIGTTDVVVDVQGWFPTASATATGAYAPLDPARLLDTRTGSGVGAGATTDVAVLGRGGVPASGVGAVVVNVVAVDPSKNTFLTVHAGGTPRPGTVSVTAEKRTTTAGLVVAPVGADGTISVYNRAGKTDLVVDVQGWFALPDPTTSAGYHATAPVRVSDSRDEDRRSRWRRIRTVQIAGVGGIPSVGVQSIVATISAADPSEDTYLTVWPTGSFQPETVNLNLRRGVDGSNLVVIPVGQGGSISTFNWRGDTDVVIDVLGWFSGAVSSSPPTTTTSTTSTTSTTTTSTTLPPTSTSTSTSTTTTTTLPPTSTSTSTSTTTSTTLPPTSTSTSTSTTTSTTLPPTSTSTSTSTTSTTSTTTTIPGGGGGGAPDPEPGAVWEMSTEQVTLDGPNQSVTVGLVSVNPDGQINNAPAPAGLRTEMLGDADAFTITELGAGRFQVRSSDQIGSVVIGVRIPGVSLTVPFTVMRVDYADGVQQVPDSAVVFPVTGLADTVDPTAGTLPDVDAAGPGSFTWAEFQARASLPTTGGLEAAADPTQVDAIIPWVLRGTAPATGTVLVGSGSSGLEGEVVERAGLPTITRSGFTLVSLRLTTLPDVYDQVKWDFTMEQFKTAGIVPRSYSYAYSCPEGLEAAQCSSPDSAPTVVHVDGALPALGVGGGGTSGRSAVPSDLTAGLPALPETCSADLSTSFLQAKLGSLEFVVDPLGEFKVVFLADNITPYRVRARFGFDASAQATISAKIQLAVAVPITCDLKDLGADDLPLPLGPLAPFISLEESRKLIFKAEGKIEGGPKVEAKLQCSASMHIIVGFDWTNGGGVQGFKDAPAPQYGCTPSWAASTDVLSGAGTPFQVEVTAGVYLKIAAGIRIGGKVAALLGKVIGDSSLGEVAPFEINVGPRFKGVVENKANVLASRDPQGTARVEINGTAEVKVPVFSWLSEKLGGPGSTFLPSFDFTLLELNIVLVTYWKTLTPDGGPSISVDGRSRTGTSVALTIGETADITAKAKPLASLTAVSTTLDAASLWMRDGASYTEVPGTVSVAGFTVTAHVEMSEALCDTVGLGGKEFYIVTESAFSYVWNQPGYAGSITISCKPTKLRWEVEQLDFDASQVGYTRTVQLIGEGMWGWRWQLSGIPPWLTVAPDHDDFESYDAAEGGDATAPIGFRVDCDQLASPGKVSASITATGTSYAPGDEPKTAVISITADCREPYIEFVPTSIANSQTVDLTSFGPTPQAWEIDPASGKFPEWVSMFPQSGAFLAGPVEHQPVTFTLVPAPKRCRSASESFTVIVRTVAVTGKSRGTAKIVLNRPPPSGQPPNCAPKITKALGDPHMLSFDGIAWEGQIVGEYVYTESLPGATHEQSVTARTTANRPGQPSSAPTSVTAVAVQYDDHRVEVYANSGTTPTLLVDGVAVTLTDGASREVVDGFAVTRSGNTFVTVGDGLSVEMSGYGFILDLTIVADPTLELRGLMGVPDGDSSNDFVGREGTVYSATDITTAEPIPFEAFVSSWRITDQGASPFTTGYTDFAAANPGFDQSVMDTYAAEVDEILAEAATICSVPATVTLRERYAIALELSIGTPRADLQRFSCSYLVTGVATSLGEPVAGMVVTVDGVGTQPCTTSTGYDGSYHCLAFPDFAEAAAAGVPVPDATHPLALGVLGTWQGRAGTVATGTASFTELAPSNGAPLSATADLAVDPSTMPWVVASGRFALDGLPDIGQHDVYLIVRDAQGGLFADVRLTVIPDADGNWVVRRALPPLAESVVVQTVVATPILETISASIAHLVNGDNPVTLATDLQLRRVRVHGTMTDGSGGTAGIGGPVTIYAWAGQPDGSVAGLATRDLVLGADGSYSIDVVLPLTSTSVNATVALGPLSETYRSATVPTPVGLTDLPFDVVHHPPVLQVAGTVTNTGTEEVWLYATYFRGASANAIGSSSQRLTLDAAGHYSAPVMVLSTADRVELEIRIGSLDSFTQSVTGLVPGDQPVTFDVDFQPVVVDLSGTMIDQASGTPLAGPVSLQLLAYNAANIIIGGASVQVYPAADGSYSTTARFGHLAVRMTATAFVNGEQITQSFTGLHTGANPVRLDLGLTTPTVVISGRFTSLSPLQTIPAQVSLQLTSYDAAGAVVPGGLRTVDATLAPDGSYSWTEALPSSVRSVSVEAQVGGGNNLWQSDWPRLTRVAVAPGHNELDLSRVFDPAVLHLSGIGKVDGAPLTSVPIDIRSFDATGTQLVFDFRNPSAASGFYSVDVPLPIGTTRVILQLHDPAYSLQRDVTLDAIGANEQRTVAVDFDEQTVQLHLAGTIDLFGGQVQPNSGIILHLTGYDENGQFVQRKDAYPSDTTDGHYAVDAVVSARVTRLTVSATGYEFPTYRQWNLAEQSFDGVTAGPFSVSYSAGLVGLNLNGTLLHADASPLAELGDTPIGVTASWTTASGPGSMRLQGTYDGSSGSFGLSQAFDDSVTHVTLRLEQFPSITPLEVDLATGWTDATWDAVTAATQLAYVHGMFPSTEWYAFVTSTIVVTSYDLDATQPDVATPWTVLGTTEINGLASGQLDHEFALLTELPAGADVLTVEVRPIYATQGTVQVIELATLPTATDPVVDVLIPDVTTARRLYADVHVTGQGTCVAPTMLADVTAWWFPAQPVGLDELNPAASGGTNLGTHTILPSLATSTMRQVWDIPAGPGWVLLSAVPWAGYAGALSGRASTSFDVGPDGDIGVSLAAAFDCTGVPPTGPLLHLHGSFPGATPELLAGSQVVVSTYRIDPADYLLNPPYQLVGRSFTTVTAGLDPDTYDLRLPAPSTFDVLTVEVRVGGAEHGQVEVFLADELPDPQATELDLPFDVMVGRHVSVDAAASGDGSQTPVACPAITLLTDITMWWFPTAPTETTGDPGTWAGAVPLGTKTIVPEIATTRGVQQWALPDGVGYVVVIAGSWRRYSGFSTSYGWGIEIPESGDVDTTSELAFWCDVP